MSSRQFTIEVPQLPSPEASPNWRGHWAVKYSACRQYWADVFYCAVDVRNRCQNLVFKVPGDLYHREAVMLKARLDLVFVFAEKRERDEDNLRASFKSGQDALVAALWLPSDSTQYIVAGSIDVQVDPQRAPLTVITLTEV